MSIFDGRIYDGPTFYGDAPEEAAMRYVRGARLKDLVAQRCIPPYFDPTAKLVPPRMCYEYLKLIRKENWDCTCRAKVQRPRGDMGEYAKHGENCGVSPEYAKLCREMNIAPELAFGAISMSMWYLDWNTWDQSKIKEMKWSEEQWQLKS